MIQGAYVGVVVVLVNLFFGSFLFIGLGLQDVFL